MLEVPVYNRSGEQIDTIAVDEQALGGTVKMRLMRDAVIMYEANNRLGTANTKTRGEVCGSRRKMYRQKGTGRARHGNRTVPGLRGGAKAFGPHTRDFHFRMPRKALQAATKSALLGKMIDGEVAVIDEMAFAQPKTREMAVLLKNLKINGSCLLGVEAHSPAAYKSARNIPKVDLKVATDINAYDVLLRKNLLLTREALNVLLQNEAAA